MNSTDHFFSREGESNNDETQREKILPGELRKNLAT